ncbi:MAG: histidinol-phosphatase [Mogibacterium sp.]|nr:histidinol-phosphatase [Mogibacterium sp.]
MESRKADIHTHILPGVDDGSPDMETSMRMIDIAYSEGIRRLFLTPHYMSGHNDYEPGTLKPRFAEIEQEAKRNYHDLELYLGNEVYYTPGTLEDLKAGKIETMAGSRYVLVEFSPRDSFEKIYQATREITNRGYFMLVAHVERYRCMEKKRDHFDRLAGMGAYFQTNASAIVKGEGHAPSTVSRWNRKVVIEDWISFLGSDAHDMKYRAPRVAEAAEWIRRKNPSSADSILWSNSQALLNDKPL